MKSLALREWLFVLCALVVGLGVLFYFLGVRSLSLYILLFLASAGGILLALVEKGGPPPK
jgi:hypothetical protein